MAEILTRPELATERAIARRRLAKLLREGSVCDICVHRDPQAVFGRSVCQTFGRTYPLCEHSPGKKFEADHAKLEGES